MNITHADRERGAHAVFRSTGLALDVVGDRAKQSPEATVIAWKFG